MPHTLLATEHAMDERPVSRYTNTIIERTEGGLVILSPARQRPTRRVLFVNSYGGRKVWEGVRNRTWPSHHLWGCPELVEKGYEIALAEPLTHFNPYRPVPHDLPLLRFARSWLGADDIVYSGHTLLHWIPFVEQLRITGRRRPVVSVTYAREDLAFIRAHAGVIALTGAAADEARKRAPGIKVAPLGWGADLAMFPALPYQPEWFLSCGKTHRDQETLRAATLLSQRPLRLVLPDASAEAAWPHHVSIVNAERNVIPYEDLLTDYYGRCFASLIILENDPRQYTAVGMTNLIETMAMGRPAIVTRTGALPTEVDVEREGCGLHVPARDPRALADAFDVIADNPQLGRSMGDAGRRLAATRYNINRFATELHGFFEQL